MIAKFVRGVGILKLTRYGGENQVQCVFSSGEVYHLF